MKSFSDLVSPSDLVVLRDAYSRMAEDMHTAIVDLSLRTWEFDDADRRMARCRAAEVMYRQRERELNDYLRSL